MREEWAKTVQEEWMDAHRAFVMNPSLKRPVWLRQAALMAIDSGAARGASMAVVHDAIKSAHLPASLVNLVVDRLVEDGHVHREKVQTAGRPRVQMWSFRHAPEEVRDAMARRGLGTDYSRPFWAGKPQDALILDVLRLVPDTKLKAREIQVAAWQIYVDASLDMDRVLFKGPGDACLTYAGMKKKLTGMVQMRQLRSNEKIDAFCL
jgi:hypothetical protein